MEHCKFHKALIINYLTQQADSIGMTYIWTGVIHTAMAIVTVGAMAIVTVGAMAIVTVGAMAFVKVGAMAIVTLGAMAIVTEGAYEKVLHLLKWRNMQKELNFMYLTKGQLKLHTL